MAPYGSPVKVPHHQHATARCGSSSRRHESSPLDCCSNCCCAELCHELDVLCSCESRCPLQVKKGPLGLACLTKYCNCRAVRLSSAKLVPRRRLEISAHPQRRRRPLVLMLPAVARCKHNTNTCCHPGQICVPSTGAHFFTTKPTALTPSQLFPFPFRSPFTFARRPSPTAAFSSVVCDAVSSKLHYDGCSTS